MLKIYEDNRILNDKRITLIDKPRFIYIPLHDKKGCFYKKVKKNGDYVYKGEVVARNKKNDFPIHSPVSGYVTSSVMKMITDGSVALCVEIENDFKEKYDDKEGFKKDISNFSRDELVFLLKEGGITYNGNPIYLDFKNDYQYLIINTIADEPYVNADDILLVSKIEDILECIDAISLILSLKCTYLVLKDSNEMVTNTVLKYIGTYPNIKLFFIDDDYMKGMNDFLTRIIVGTKKAFVFDVSTTYAIYEKLKYDVPYIHKVITIRGHGIKNPSNVSVKIGSLAKEVIEELGGYQKINNPIITFGGLLKGDSAPNDDVVITGDINSIMVIPNNFENEKKCISCGKCSEICPANIIPIYARKYYRNKKILKKLNLEKCIGCALCSYICPSKIELCEYIKEARRGL